MAKPIVIAPEMQAVLDALDVETLRELAAALREPQSTVYHWNKQLLSGRESKVEVPLRVWLKLLATPSKWQQYSA